MREFSKVSPAIWSSPKFRGLPDDARQALLYFITSAHQNACGCFALPDGYSITDLQWALERFRLARAALVDASMILFDEATSEVLVAKWFQHNPPMNPSHRKSVIAAVERIASDVLRAEAYKALAEAESQARTKNEARSANASVPLLRTPHLARSRLS